MFSGPTSTDLPYVIAASLIEADISPIVNLHNTWIHTGQVPVASTGSFAFIFALAWMS